MAEAPDPTADVPPRRFRPYRYYKDSGVEWLGGIPAHWEPARLWRLCSATSGATPTKENPAYWNGEVPWVSPKDMKRRVISTSEDLITQQALDQTGIKLIAPRGVLVVVRGMILAHSFPVAVTAAPVTINQDMKALRLIDGVDAFYFAWALDGLARGIIATVVEEAAHGTRAIRMDQWRRLVVPLPPYLEQKAIAAFLDRETAKIDALLARKERLIELLQEKRTALITRAVTRGLDPSVPMKDSGVEWLGEIPAHWDTWKATHGFRWIGSGTTPKSDDPDFYDGDIPWVTTSELRETVVMDTTKKVTDRAMREYPTLHIYPGGTLLFAMYGATIGRLGILGIPATVNQACAALAEPLHLTTWFVYYWLQMRRPMLIVLSAGGGQPNLSQDDLRQLRIPAPPLDEQRAIAAFLDYETAKIDALIGKVRGAIEHLKEFRVALISAAVTGRIDVRTDDDVRPIQGGRP